MKILLLGGNALATEVLKALSGHDVLYSSLTKYGAECVESGVETVYGALDADAFEELVVREGIELVLDVTHPFAEEISRLAIESSERLGIPYLRYEEAPLKLTEEKVRESVKEYDVLPGFSLTTYSSQKEAAVALEKTRGKILLTTGSNNLEDWENLRKRLIVRVLPRASVLKKCEELGFSPGQIIAEQGPFSLEENLAQLSRYGCTTLVTKEGGKNSGFEDKLAAAYVQGIQLVVIEAPKISYPNRVTCLAELKREIEKIEGRAKRIMFQGTGSSVGKSLLNAALCRILHQDGYEVAPFKSQNMALNSFITEDGLEMGRAQVTQAECAGKKPRVEMNPVLLKPNSDDGSQVILNGKVWKNLSAQDYYVNKEELLEEVLKSYRILEGENDVLVIEGAGSPAEINLRENDIVNMGFAEAVDAPVILVCDIDKGGVFASLYGTLLLLEKEERERIKGYIINKFRGDVKLLQPGIDMIGELIDIPCLGVMPYIRLDIDDEDSVTERFGHTASKKDLTIGVVRLKHFSNASDFTVFHSYDDIDVEYYQNAREIEEAEPDVLIIPGSKNTIDDMQALREAKMEEAILEKAEKIPVVGICGGFQMMGETIEDPLGVESSRKSIRGLGLLDITTRLNATKQTTQIRAKTLDGEYPLTGYEIHMGETVLGENAKPFSQLEDGRYDGARSREGHFGTYLHGLFDSDTYRDAFLRSLGYRGGDARKYSEYKESQYDLLAEAARKHLDIEALYRIIDAS